MSDKPQTDAEKRDATRLDDKGRCCGRKPLKYKRPRVHYFCTRCNREFNEDGEQVPNFAYKQLHERRQ